MERLTKKTTKEKDGIQTSQFTDFYKKCQNVDSKKLLLAFRKAQLIVAQDAVKKAE